MKKKIYFVVAMGICLSLLMNCAKPDLDPIGTELEEGVPFGKKQLSITKVGAQTVAKNPRMQKTMQKIQGKRLAKMQTNGRTLENTGYFKLQMTDIVMVEKGGYTSYTFAVLRDQDSGYMENIIVNLYANGTMKTYFVEYDFTEAEKMALINYGNIPSDPKSQAYLMDNLEEIFSNDNVMRFSPVYEEIMCPEITYSYVPNTCPQGHDSSNYQSANDGNGCGFYNDGTWNPFPPFFTSVYVTYVPCGGGSGVGSNPNNGIPDGIGNPSEGGGGGFGSGNDSSPPDGNPADNNPPDDPNDPSDPELVNNDGDVHTVPVPPKEVPKTPHEKNCEKLNEMVANIAIQNSLITLQGKVNQNKEFGYSHSLDNTNPVTEAQRANNSDIHIIMPTGGLIYGFSHTHPFESNQSLEDKRVIPMFSLTDIFGFARLIVRHNNPNADPSIFFMSLTVKNGDDSSNTFVIKIENKQSFINWAQSYNALSKDVKITKGNNLNEMYNKRLNAGGGYTGYLKDMLKFMKDENINGVGVYKANDEQFSGWKKMELNQAGDEVTEEGLPCN